MSASPRPGSLPSKGGSVRDRVNLFNTLAKNASATTQPILPTRQYKPASFTKKFKDTSNAVSDEDHITSGKKLVIKQTDVLEFPKSLRFHHLLNNKSQKQLTEDFEKYYTQNPNLWDSIIDCVRFQLRYGEFGNDIDEPVPPVDESLNDNQIHTFSTEIMNEINKVRENPVAYAAVVQTRFERFVDDHVYKLQSGEYMKTVEGQEGILEAVAFLRNTTPLPRLEVSPFLSQTTVDHIEDMLANDLMGHESSNSFTLKDRIEKYCQWRGQIGENIRFGSCDATEIIINLLIDDGVEARGQRKNILNKEFKFVGASLAAHDVYRYVCVMNFTGDLIDNNMILKDSSVKVCTKVEDLNDIEVKRIIASIPYNGDMVAEITKEFAAQPPGGLQVTLDFLYNDKKAKISYKRGPRTTMRTLTWA